MNGLREFVKSYIAVWNESNEEIRKKKIEQLWSGDLARTNRDGE
ncbi:hypothetical protein [Robertmurraya sp. Marseille-Q9965]